MVVLEFLIDMGNLGIAQLAGHTSCAIEQIVLVERAAVDPDPPEGLERGNVPVHHLQRIPGEPVVPALFDQLACLQINRQADAAESLRVRVIAGCHGKNHEHMHVGAGIFGSRFKSADEILNGSLLLQGPQGGGHVRQIAELERHVAGMAGNGGPDIRMQHAVYQRSVAAGRLAETGSFARTAAAEVAFDSLQHLACQIGCPRPHGCTVDILVPAQACETIGKGHNDGRQGAFVDQPVEAGREVLAEVLPADMAKPAACETGQIDQERQTFTSLAIGNIDRHIPRDPVAKHVPAEKGGRNLKVMNGSLGAVWKSVHGISG